MADKTGLEFEEPRVVELWLLAKKANFSDVELTSFKVRQFVLLVIRAPN